MNLRWVHAFLILLSAALAVLFGVWCLGQYGRDNGVASLIAAVAGICRVGRFDRLRLVVPAQDEDTSMTPPLSQLRRYGPPNSSLAGTATIPAPLVRLTRLRSFARYASESCGPLRRRLLVVIAGSTRLLACPVCFGAEETSMIDGAKLGVLVMLAVTLVVQGGFLGFFLYLRNRAKRIADVELDTEWSELQRSPKTS